MRTVFALFLALSVALVLWTGVEGGQAKDMTIKGKITCAKCDLKIAKDNKCATVVVEKKDKMETIYYFDADSDKKNHKDICTTPKNGTVTGAVSEKDGKHWIAVKEIKYDK
jgi:hypothetical protein